MSGEQHRIVMFSDARVGTDRLGRVASTDPAVAGEGWRRGLEGLPNIRLHVRVDPRPGTGTHPLADDVVALPFFVGLASFVRRAPALLRAMTSAISASEVVVTRLPGLVGSCASALALAKGRPLATELVGDPFEALGASGTLHGRALGLGGRMLTRAIVRRAAVVRYVTQRVLQESYPSGRYAISIAASDVKLAPWLVEAAADEAAEPTVIAVGSQEQLYKGHTELISAVAFMHDHDCTVRLVLVGTGRHQQDLRSHATRSGVGDQVDFVGYVDNVTELREQIDRSWVYAMPSHTEGLPRSLLEAMTRARACVGSDVGGIRELLPEAYRVPPKDPARLAEVLTRLIGDADERSSAGRANRERARRYLAANAMGAETWRDAVQNLLPGGSRA